MAGRTTRTDQLGLALEELRRLDAVRIEPAPGAAVVVHGKTGRWTAPLHAYDSVDEPLARSFTRGRGRGIVVANRISGPARSVLERKGWSWLDRRIGAHIADDDRDIEIRYADGRPPTRVGGVTDGSVRGRAGIAYAAALLCSPDTPPSMRSVAGAVGMSPQSISNAAAAFAEAGLVETDQRPVLPDLFWALAVVWQPSHQVTVASAPDSGDWVLGGDAAAAALGAPVVNLDDRPLLWAPDAVTLRRAERRLGLAAHPDERRATIAVAPTPLVVTTARPHQPWALPHPVFAALDLARDRGRGREILDQWTPEGATVVWR